MASLEPFVRRIKPAMDEFLRAPTKDSIANLECELLQFNWTEMKIFHVHILLPLVLKLEELNEQSQELRTGTMNCIRIVTTNLYLDEKKGLRTLVCIILRQIRDCTRAAPKQNLSEEIKLAAVLCMMEALRRSTTDVLEHFYTAESDVLAQVLLTLVEFVELEKFRKLILAAMECLMTVFYVHDEADGTDVVLRSQVADVLFIYLPKIVTVLFKTTLADQKLGVTVKMTAVKALGRIVRITCEETNRPVIQSRLKVGEFRELISAALHPVENATTADADLFDTRKNKVEVLERLKRMQTDGRSPQWFAATSRKLRVIFKQTSILRSHESACIRREYAQMCCGLIEHCAHHLSDNFMYLLESIVAMAEDEDEMVRKACQRTLQQLQGDATTQSFFDDNCGELLDAHLIKLPRIINRCDEAEQFAEYMFLKGFLRYVNSSKLQLLLAVPTSMETFCMCLVAMVELNVTRDLLVEEHSLRPLCEANFLECSKSRWRQYKNLNSVRCIQTVQSICEILGRTNGLNGLLYAHMLERLERQSASMNELLLLMSWMLTTTTGRVITDEHRREIQPNYIELLLAELLNEQHWHLALQPDQALRLRADKPSSWYIDRTPGLYESAIEVRTQDYDSDDENDTKMVERADRVTIIEAEFNVLHTCVVLDALAHCATILGESFDAYLFRFLHRVLLKVANSNLMVFQAAYFALISIQKALHFSTTSQLIETHTDYITYHLNTILRRSPESQSAVDILSVVLQFSSSDAIPHLDSIFQTMRIECSKTYQADNVNSYLKVYNAFLDQITRWQLITDNSVTANSMPMEVEGEPFIAWVEILEKGELAEDDIETITTTDNAEQRSKEEMSKNEKEQQECEETKPPVLPRHIEMIKDILRQVLKFITSADKVHQILALECLNSGIPLLRHNEDELLPLVHEIWQPLVEKFRQKDAIVLNRCFSLLNTLATHAKDFIRKRTLDDVIPFLKAFLEEASKHSAHETITTQTQEYKLQCKLLQDFANLIQCMQIDGRQLNDIAEVIAVYLSESQPNELQHRSVHFFQLLRSYNGPLAYFIALKRAHLSDCALNVEIVLGHYGIK